MSKLKSHIVYAGDVFHPVKSVNQFFAKNEKDLMEGYRQYCVELGENVPIEPFVRDMYMDFYFENQHSLN